MISPKLKSGDTVAIVAPSRSLAIIGEDTRRFADANLRSMGLELRCMPHISESDDFNSTTVRARVEDLHSAFGNPAIAGLLTVLGGFNSNQLLRSIDFDLIKANPKVLCGYSDITALANAIYARTGLVTYSGPHYSTFGVKKGNHYTHDYFRKCLFEDVPFDIKSSEAWSDDEWYLDQDNRHFTGNIGYRALAEGSADGTLLGGNLCTFNLLQGTEYMPSLDGSILFVEDDYSTDAVTFDRNLVSLIHQPGFGGVHGIVIGRFQKKSNIPSRLLDQIIRSKSELKGMPIIADADFGHTLPMFTFPIGGRVRIRAENGKGAITILEH